MNHTATGERAHGGRFAGLVAGLLLGFGLSLACGAESAGPVASDPPAETGPEAASESRSSPVPPPPAVSDSSSRIALPMVAAATEGELPSLAPILERVRPGVVTIISDVRRSAARERQLPWPFEPFMDPRQAPREARSGGSGVIVNAEEGLILTNHHVISDASRITVLLLSGAEREAELVGSDPEADVAVLKIEPGDLVAVPVGDSNVLRVGDFVLAIGSPFRLGQTVTSGIVSALGRSGIHAGGPGEIEPYEDYIQTDAAINMGNSGGALINLRGELVGINTAIFSNNRGSIGIGFAIPSNMARSLMDQILEYGQVRRGQLGVRIQDLTEDLAALLEVEAGEGAVVAEVMEDSPADRAGIEAGDVIVEMDGEAIDSASDLRNRVGLESVGHQVELEILRKGKQLQIRAELAERDAPPQALASTEPERRGEEGIHPQLEGVTLQNAPDGKGVEVVEVGPGAGNGLRPGDIIRGVKRSPVSSLSELREALEDEDKLLLRVEREGATFYLVLQ